MHSDHEATLADAVRLIDSSDDLDTKATIGDPADVLADLLRERTLVDAVAALRESGADLDRVQQALCDGQTPEWKREWLVRRCGLSQELANRVVENVDPGRITSVGGDARSLRTLSSILAAETEQAAGELRSLLAQYGAPATPDTMPDGWVDTHGQHGEPGPGLYGRGATKC